MFELLNNTLVVKRKRHEQVKIATNIAIGDVSRWKFRPKTKKRRMTHLHLRKKSNFRLYRST